MLRAKQDVLKKEWNKHIIIYQMKSQLLGKTAIIWVWGKLTQEVDGVWEKKSSSCWVHVKVQLVGKIPHYSRHDDLCGGVILRAPSEMCWILRLYHSHCLLVQMVWGIFVRKVQPFHSAHAVECGINGMAVLQVKLKIVIFNVIQI